MLGFQGDMKPGMVLMPSKDFMVDQVEVFDILESEGADIQKGNWEGIYFYLPEDLDNNMFMQNVKKKINNRMGE